MVDQFTNADSTQLSIVIPTYKRPRLLAQALESVAAQTRRADEVIVADNDEAKSAASTVETFSTSIPNLKYISASTQKGAAFAWNVAGHKAAGNWLVGLDDDDYWDRTYLAAVDEAINGSGLSCIVTWVAYDLDGTINGGKRMPQDITIEKLMRDGNPGFAGTNIAIEKSLFVQLNGFDESMPSSPDIDFLIRIIESGATYHVIEEELTFLRQHTGVRLTDLSAGYRAVGAAMLLKKHGKKVSWKARRKLRGRMHASAYAASHNPISKGYHTVIATLNGNRSTARDFLKRLW